MTRPSPPAAASGDAVSLRLRSDPRYLCLVRAMVRSFGSLAGFDDGGTYRITLAVDEGCANIIRHAYGGRPDGEMEVSCELRESGADRSLVIRLLDRGKPVDLQRVTTRERRDPMLPGGLGLHFMYDIMDTVDFLTEEDGANVVQLCLACPAQGPAGA